MFLTLNGLARKSMFKSYIKLIDTQLYNTIFKINNKSRKTKVCKAQITRRKYTRNKN